MSSSAFIFPARLHMLTSLATLAFILLMATEKSAMNRFLFIVPIVLLFYTTIVLVLIENEQGKNALKEKTSTQPDSALSK